MTNLFQSSHSVMSDSLRPHRLQHARAPCPSPTSRVHPKPCPLSSWCHPAISSSFAPFSHLQSFPASGSFPMSQVFASGGQSIGVSASTSILPMNIQDLSPLGWTGWISLPDFIFLGSKITADCDYSHEIKRCLRLKRKAMTNLDSVLKSRHHFTKQGP